MFDLLKTFCKPVATFCFVLSLYVHLYCTVLPVVLCVVLE